MRKLNLSPFKLPGRFLLIGSLVLMGWPAIISAQGSGSFMANGRPIDIASFNREVVRMMDEVGVPGLSLAVIDENRIVYYNAYGVKKKGSAERVNKRTVFEGCSLSKSFLAFVAYQLVDEGKLDLDKPLYQYRKNDRLEHDPRYKLITPRMVLSHSSGLENWQSANNPDTLEIVSNPGEKYVYSGEGYQYLAKVIEGILNQSYEQYITERVIKPLKLKNTYLKFKERKSNLFHKESPWNYATGHLVLGGQTKLKNQYTLPAAGNDFTAEDYAKLILAFFDTAHLTAARIGEIVTPIIPVDHFSLYYGPGFEVVHTGNDIIIAHGGDNGGFKAQVFYSVVKKRGLVFMTNSDRGKSMDAKLCSLAGDLNVEPFLRSPVYFIAQYPEASIELLKTYDRQGTEAMFAEVGQLKKEGKLTGNSLNLASGFFKRGGANAIAEGLLQQNVELYPDSPLTYVLLAGTHMAMGRPDLAYANLTKAKEKKFSWWEIDGDLKECEADIAENKRKAELPPLKIDAEGTTIRAENYNAMSGVHTERTADIGGGHNVAYIDSADWMDYKVNVPVGGTYFVTYRVSSLSGGGKIALYSGDRALSTVNIAATKGWQNWVSLATSVELPAGDQILRVYASAGGFNINWLKFSLNTYSSK